MSSRSIRIAPRAASSSRCGDEAGPAAGMHAALIALRLVNFAALMAVFGAAEFRFYVFAGPPSEAEPQALAAFDRWLVHLVLAGAVTALGSGLLIVPCVAAT